jgi:hypothetical protein
VIIFVKVADVEALLSEDLITELGEPLMKVEIFDLAILLGVLVGNLVRTLSSEPLISPFVQVQVSVRMIFVVSSLKRGDEVVQGGVGPSELFEVDLETLTESLPTHLIDQLLEQACPLTVGNTID